MPVFDSGMMMSRTICASLAPASRAAAIRLRSIFAIEFTIGATIIKVKIWT